MAEKQMGPGCLVLFGLVFVLAGCVPGVIALLDIAEARAIQRWPQSTATLLEVDRHQGDETWSVAARYRYRAPDPAALEGGQQRDYESSRVGVHSGSDNIGSWQEDTYARLQRALKSGATVPCWYDPADPAQAVLDRTVRWELVGFMLVFPLVFGLAGGAVMWIGFTQGRRKRQAAVAPQIRSSQALLRADGGAGCGLWIIAIIWNGIAWAVALGLLLDGKAPWPVAMLVGLFPLIGLGLLFAALLATARRLRHGRPELRLERGAWLAGSRVEATVLQRTAPQPGDRLVARLLVLERVTTSTSKGSETREKTLWSLDLAIDPQAGRDQGGRWAVPIELALPGDLPASGEDVTWRLDWHLIRPGPDLSAAFTLPVAAGTEPDPALTAAALAAAADQAAPLAVLERAGIRVVDAAGEVEIALPAWRNPGLHLGGVIASTMLSGGAAALWHFVGWWTGLLAVPILALCWWGTARSCLWRSHLRLGRRRITVEAGWWRLERHELAAEQIAEVERSSSMSSNDTAWFNLWLKTGDGLRIPIARGVPGPAAARLAELIEAARGRA